MDRSGNREVPFRQGMGERPFAIIKQKEKERNRGDSPAVMPNVGYCFTVMKPTIGLAELISVFKGGSARMLVAERTYLSQKTECGAL